MTAEYTVHEEQDGLWTAVVTYADGHQVTMPGWQNEVSARVAAGSLISRVGFGNKVLRPGYYTGRRP